MTEDYVSFPVAKLLKEKRFDITCRSIFVYSERKDGSKTTQEFFDYEYTHEHITNCDNHTKGWQENWLRPTQALACKWMREKHGIHIYASEDEGIYNTQNEDGNSWGWTINKTKDYKCGFDSYEQAIDAALEYSLKNLII